MYSDNVGKGFIHFPDDRLLQQGQKTFEQMPFSHDELDDYGSTNMGQLHQHNASQLYKANMDNFPDTSHEACLGGSMESVERSFCFAAIDGLLTGSGLSAAFYGMGYLSSDSSLALRWCVVAFTFAVCTSDGICMALGHIWSTHVLASSSAKEIRLEKETFHKHRAMAKSKLVGILLSKGMLKIDAMSIVDTLEGYPEIFINALASESGHLAGSTGSFLANGGGGGSVGHSDADESRSIPEPHRLSALSTVFGPAVGDGEMDPEEIATSAQLSESRSEGLVMMLSFSVFATLPSLIFAWLPLMAPKALDRKGIMSTTSLTVCITIFIVLLLGMWKSKFFGASRIVFGLETVVVLLVCVMSAYWIGAALSSVLPEPFT